MVVGISVLIGLEEVQGLALPIREALVFQPCGNRGLGQFQLWGMWDGSPPGWGLPAVCQVYGFH